MIGLFIKLIEQVGFYLNYIFYDASPSTGVVTCWLPHYLFCI